MFIVSKALLISSATVIVRACCMGVIGMFAIMWEEGSSPVSAITERRDMGLYEVPMSVSLLGFGLGPMLANFHV